jgi:hypothetical protein
LNEPKVTTPLTDDGGALTAGLSGAGLNAAAAWMRSNFSE